MYLGEVINSLGERVEIQFKGAGTFPDQPIVAIKI